MESRRVETSLQREIEPADQREEPAHKSLDTRDNVRQNLISDDEPSEQDKVVQGEQSPDPVVDRWFAGPSMSFPLWFIIGR